MNIQEKVECIDRALGNLQTGEEQAMAQKYLRELAREALK